MGSEAYLVQELHILPLVGREGGIEKKLAAAMSLGILSGSIPSFLAKTLNPKP